MRKGIVLALLLGAWSAQGQEIVRKGGEATGVDAEVKDLTITPGYVADLEDWRFGIEHLLVFQKNSLETWEQYHSCHNVFG